jgi:hypothetical protein
VKDAFKAPGTPEYFSMSQAFFGSGTFGSESVVNIPVSGPFGQPARLYDLEATLAQTVDGGQVLVVAAGDPGLTIVNPATQSLLWNDKVTVERDEGGQKVVEATLSYSYAIGLGNLSGQDVAVVVGGGTIEQETQNRPLLMVVSLTDPQNPVGLGYVPLESAWLDDVILKDDLALLGDSKQVTLVSLTDLARPRILGTVQGVGGRLALGENGSILFSTERSQFGGTNLPLGGMRTAALDTVAVVRKLTPAPYVFQADQLVLGDNVAIEVALVPGGREIQWAKIEILRDGTPIEELPAALAGSVATAVWPLGRKLLAEAAYAVKATVKINPELIAGPKRVPLVRPVDLQIQKLPEETAPPPNEEIPGAVIPINDDDDDKDRTPDLEQTPATGIFVNGENDLVPVKLVVASQQLQKGTVTWSVTNGPNRLKAWLDPEKSQLAPQRNWDITDPSIPQAFYLEGVALSDQGGDVELQLFYTKQVGLSYTDKVNLTVLGVDLDVDSENDDGLNLNPLGRTKEADRIEDVADKPDDFPGKLVVVNDNDDDEDRVPDFADGYNLDPGTTPRATADDVNERDRFVPLVLELSRAVDLQTARLRFTYSASDPLGVTIPPGQSEPEIRYSIPAGRLRIWKKSGGDRRDGRNCASSPDGDFVPSQVVLAPNQVGITPAKRTVTLYLEGLARSDRLAGDRILVEVDPDGAGPIGYIVSDAVRVTVVRVRLVDRANTQPDNSIIGGGIAWIFGGTNASPDPAMPRLEADILPPIPTHTARWSMKTRYDRPDRATADEVFLPNNDSRAVEERTASAKWDIRAAIDALPDESHFFGGKAKLKVDLELLNPLFSHELHFEIRGRNPEDGVARAFIDGNTTVWFAYAIAKHESKARTAAGTAVYYNQFLPDDANACVGPPGPCARIYRAEDAGLPYFTYSPEGWGIMQLDRSAGAPGSTAMGEIWNWQSNVQSGLAELGRARQQATNWMWSLRPHRFDPTRPAGQRPQSQVDTGRATYTPPPPSLPGQDGTLVIVNPNVALVPVPNFPATGTYPNCSQFNDANIEDPLTMKIYNGADRHFVGWISAAVGWRFEPVNQVTNVNYAREVCREVDP